jgi:3-deoxy-D-manno-octulosonic-acid transferase
MNRYQFAYNALASAVALIGVPLAWCYARRDPARRAMLAQRLGYCPSGPSQAGRRHPTVWIHAVSVGEVKAAQAVVNALTRLCPDVFILLTTTTASGQRYAIDLFSTLATVQYAPLDLWWSTRRFIRAHRPDLLACMETEIWPNWITIARRTGIEVVFVNGRISARSIRPYRKVRPLIGPLLTRVNAFSMISEPDARRIVGLGAPAGRVCVNGNVKMDVQHQRLNHSTVDRLRQQFGVDTQTPVFVAGSVRGAETEAMLSVFQRLAARIPGLLFIIAPRHIENAARIAALADQNGVVWQYRTRLGKDPGGRHAPLVILDTIGELRHVYGMASVVFCGASLVPLGGQNVVEAAVWAKPVLYGPYMDDFEEARCLLESCGGGICVPDAAVLADRAAHLLANPDQARRLGHLALTAVMANQGAALRHARVIADLLVKKASAVVPRRESP